MKPVGFHPAAGLEVGSSYQRYLQRSTRTANTYYSELNRIFERIRDQPDLFPRIGYGTQRAILARFPFCVVYRQLSAEIQVLAVAHTSRKPEYWLSRLDNPDKR